MVATKICAWGTCKNDSRYPHLHKRYKNNDPYHFPGLYDRQKGDIKWTIADPVYAFATNEKVICITVNDF